VAKLPKPDLDRIRATPAEYETTSEFLWRLHSPSHPEHPTRWDQLRTFGPLKDARFDPWSPPADEHATESVGYFGLDMATCLAEKFQTTRHVNPNRFKLQLTAFRPQRTLMLLDLRHEWPIKLGASHTINSGPKHLCRQWAQALRGGFPDADGLCYTGMAGRDCVVLYGPVDGVFPSVPDFSRPLRDPAMASRVADACQQIGYSLAPY
jgi:hypothetical protein